ncbi:MAG: FHA domain-containing protein [Dehalococcoidia bacterium]|nr:FHA domain-containing protein [Dehalococcoidia bacterium]
MTSPSGTDAESFIAELRTGNRRIQVRVAGTQRLLLGRRTEGEDAAPDIDLGEIPGGRTVSRKHAYLSHRDGHWLLEPDASAANPTLLNGAVLEYRAPSQVGAADQLQLGGVTLTFHPFQQAPPDVISLELESTEIDVIPGEPVQVLVTLTNHTGRVERFQVEAIGLPPSWYRLYLPDAMVSTPAVYLLNSPPGAVPIPEARQRLRLIIQPPRDAKATAGTYPFQVIATTSGEPRERGSADAILRVEPFEQLELAVEPDEIRGVQAAYKVELRNLGNATASVQLKAAGEGLAFDWGEPLAEVAVENGERRVVDLIAQAKSRHWQGVDFRYNFWISAKAGIAEPPPQRAQLIVPPRIPAWIQAFWGTFYALLAPVILLVLILVFAYLFLRPPDILNLKTEIQQGRRVSLTALLDRPCVTPKVEGGPGDFPLVNDKGERRSDCGFWGGLTAALPWVARPVVWNGIAPLQAQPLTLVVWAQNLLGISSSQNLNVPAVAVPEVVSFKVDPPRLKKETETVELSWQTRGANAVKVLRVDNVGAVDESVPRDLNVPITQVAGAISDTLRSGTTDYLLLAAIADQDPTPESMFRILVQCSSGLEEVNACVARKSRLASAELKFAQCKPKLLNKERCDLPDVVMSVLRVVVEKPVITAFSAAVPQVNPGGEVLLKWDTQNATNLALVTKAAGTPMAGGLCTTPTPAPAPLVSPLDLHLNQLVVTALCDVEYLIRAGNAGGFVEQGIKLKVAPIDVVTFTAQPVSVAKGDPVTLTWNALGAAWLELQPGGIIGPGETSRVVKPEATTEYTLTAYGPNRSGQPATKQVTVNVGLPAVKADFFQAVNPVLNKGESTTLLFSVQNARQITITGSDKSVALDEPVASPTVQMSVTVSPQQTTVYTLTVKNESGQVALTATVTVQPAGPAAVPSATPAATAAASPGAQTGVPPGSR